MKDLIKFVIASLLGAALGRSFVPSERACAAASQRIETTELVLIDQAGKPLARMVGRSGGAVLEFYDTAGARAAEFGFEEPGASKFLTFLDKGDRVVAGLNSSDSRGETTLFLGDADLQAHVVLGAIPSDVQEPERNWGLQINTPGSLIPVFSVLAKPGKKAGAWNTGIRMVEESGKIWAR